MHEIKSRTLFLTALIGLAVVARLLPHPPNFSPLGALALFGGASFADRRLALFIPLTAMLISDLFLGLHATLPAVYACLAINVLIGRWAGNGLAISRLLPAAVVGSLIFFLGTNLVYWLAFYDPSWQSLVTCFTMALPFYQYTLASDLVFGGILFGALGLAQAYFPTLRPATRQAPELQSAAA